ncbi:MAG TPA: hypothetical protein VFI35_08015 [Actinomycetota bacterium]|nr:hypothetical protein [Actinomycetota bacterium]
METHRRLEALGADRFLTKPLNLQLFLQTLDELLAWSHRVARIRSLEVLPGSR